MKFGISGLLLIRTNLNYFFNIILLDFPPTF